MTTANSSLAYEILLYLNTYYFALFALAELGVTFFKIIELPYPTGTLISEILIFVFLCITEAVRIFMGRKGNLTEKKFPVVMSLALTAPSVLGTVYFLVWQTYVLQVELILCSVQLTLQGLELCFGVVCLMRFFRAGTY